MSQPPPFIAKSWLATEIVEYLGGAFLLLQDSCKELFSGKKRGLMGLTIDQVYQIGIRSLPLVLITALATGMVMTLQYGLGLARFGGTPYVPKLVTISILREMGPVFSSLLVAARVAAGIASEVGSMVVTQQVDAIRALGTSPIQKIVLPRILASFIAVPILVIIANLVGLFGALLIGVSELNLDGNFFWLKALGGVKLADFLSGYGKSFFFSFFISLTACYYGLTVEKGTKGVGLATTKAVVTASVLILLGDFVLTKLFWMIEKLV